MRFVNWKLEFICNLSFVSWNLIRPPSGGFFNWFTTVKPIPLPPGGARGGLYPDVIYLFRSTHLNSQSATNYQISLTKAIYSFAFIIFIYIQKLKHMKNFLLFTLGLVISILLIIPNQAFSQKANGSSGSGNSVKSLDIFTKSSTTVE